MEDLPEINLYKNNTKVQKYFNLLLSTKVFLKVHTPEE